jgi:hypothetical protein
MSLMNGVFHEYLDKFYQVFIDEILIYSRTKEERTFNLGYTRTFKLGTTMFRLLWRKQFIQETVEMQKKNFFTNRRFTTWGTLYLLMKV